MRCHPLVERTTAGKKNVVEAVTAASPYLGCVFITKGVAVPASAECSGNLGQSLLLAAKAIVPSHGCCILCLGIQAAAPASTNEYLGACILCSMFPVSAISIVSSSSGSV